MSRQNKTARLFERCSCFSLTRRLRIQRTLSNMSRVRWRSKPRWLQKACLIDLIHSLVLSRLKAEFVLASAQTLIYLTDKRHRDLVANYFHAQGIPLADFSRRGANENKRDRAELARLIEGFKTPPGATPPKVSLACRFVQKSESAGGPFQDWTVGSLSRRPDLEDGSLCA